MVINLPNDADLTLGKWIGSADIDEQKPYVLHLLESIEVNTKVKHASMRVFMGFTAVCCRFCPDKKNLPSPCCLVDLIRV